MCANVQSCPMLTPCMTLAQQANCRVRDFQKKTHTNAPIIPDSINLVIYFFSTFVHINVEFYLVLKIVMISTIVHFWYGGHFTSINVCGVWKLRIEIQIFKRKFHTYILMRPKCSPVRYTILTLEQPVPENKKVQRNAF